MASNRSADETRAPGLYWVRFRLSGWTVAEWVLESHQDGEPTWYLLGSDVPCPSSEVDEVDERRLVRDETAEVERLRAEVEDLRSSVIAFGGPWAVAYARECGLPPDHLHPVHYDILAKAGARMDDFVRSEKD